MARNFRKSSENQSAPVIQNDSNCLWSSATAAHACLIDLFTARALHKVKPSRMAIEMLKESGEFPWASKGGKYAKERCQVRIVRALVS